MAPAVMHHRHFLCRVEHFGWTRGKLLTDRLSFEMVNDIFMSEDY